MFRRAFGQVARLGYSATTLGLGKGAHVTRYAMYRSIARHREPRPPEHRALSISHSEAMTRLLGYTDAQITDASYPECNILNLPFPDAAFDAVVSDQVLEHVEGDPFRAVAETLRVLKPGGIVLHATCFINPVHGEPGDFWRFTPDALRLLVGDSVEVVDARGWGNPVVWPFCMMGLRFVGIPHAKWHPAHWLGTANHSRWPIVTWVLGRKRHALADREGRATPTLAGKAAEPASAQVVVNIPGAGMPVRSP